MSPATFAAVVAAAVFIGLSALAAWLILFAASREQGRLQRRLAGADAVPADGLGAPGDAPLLREFARRGQALEKVVDTEGESARLMIQAGWRDSRSRLVFYAFQGLLPLVLLLVVAIGWTLDWGRLFQAPLVFLIAVFAVILGILIPRWVLRSAAAGRRQR